MKVFLVHSSGMQVTQWFEKIIQCVPDDLQVVDKQEECDVVCIRDLTTNSHAKNVTFIAHYAKQFQGKKIAIFLHDDPDIEMHFLPDVTQHMHIFRTSLCASRKQPFESLLPSFQCEDQQFQPLEPCTSDAITIGFVGAVTSADRTALCTLLQNDPRFRTAFVFRSSFHGHFDDDQKNRNHEEYKQNLQANMYQVCCRGAGNFSHRFYEVLASGRVPVLPDTDIVIPEHIPPEVWRNCVVLASNIVTVPDALYAFHKTHDAQTVQQNCFKMWRDFLSVKSFAPIVVSKINKIV